MKITDGEVKYFFDCSMDIDFFDRQNNPPITIDHWRKLDDLYFNFSLINKKKIPVAKQFIDDYNLELLGHVENPSYFEKRATKFMTK